MTKARNLSKLTPSVDGLIESSDIAAGTTVSNAATATTLQTARTINGVSFNGSANITVADSTKLPLAGGTMTGAISFAAAQTWPTFNQNTTGSAGSVAWTGVTGKPTTLSGYGITDAYSSTNPSGYITSTGSISGNAATASAVAWTGVTGKPTTLSGYGITDGQSTLVSGTNIKTVNGTSLLGSGDLAISASTVPWTGVTSKPSNIMYYQGFTLDANTMDSNSTGFTYSVNAPATGPVARFSTGGGYDLWLNSAYSGGNTLYFRTRNGDAGSVNAWRALASYGVNYADSLYGTILYDSNNTGYYCDPSNTSNLNAVQASNFKTQGAYGAQGNLGSISASWAGSAYPTLYSDSSDRWVMHINPHISFTRNGYNGYTGSMTGSTIRFASDYAATTYWDLGVNGGSANLGNDVYGLSRAGTWNAYWDNGGNAWSRVSHRSPIFYDNDNTGYYCDPNSTSSLSYVYANRIILDRNYGHSIFGTYASTRYQGVWSMGQSWALPDDGTTTGNLYGLAWSHPNAGGTAGNLNTHGLLVLENGGFLAALSGSIRCRDDMRTPIYYDSNNTGYYMDANNTSRMNAINADSLYSYGNVTAYSDENLKTDWEDLPQDYIEQLAKVKSGKYTRIDTKERQAGVGARSFKNILPEVVIKNGDYLGVNYGNAALVSAIELAKRVVEQDNRIARLEELISKLIDN